MILYGIFGLTTPLALVLVAALLGIVAALAAAIAAIVP